MKRLLVVSVALFVTLSACAGGLGKKDAGEAIEKALQGGRVSLPLQTGRVGSKCADQAAKVLNVNPTTAVEFVASQQAGLITVTPDGPDFWKVAPTDPSPAALEAAKKLPHLTANGCDYQPFGFVVAMKTLVDVTDIHQITDATAEAEFMWKWKLTSQGEKYVDRLSHSQISELDWRLYNSAFSEPDSRFSLANLSASTASHTAKLTLKKSEDGWHVAK